MNTLGIAGFSGSGKTTLLVRLIPELKARGLRVSTIKHTHHAVALDRKGDVSRRLASARSATGTGAGTAPTPARRRGAPDQRRLWGDRRDSRTIRPCHSYQRETAFMSSVDSGATA